MFWGFIHYFIFNENPGKLLYLFESQMRVHREKKIGEGVGVGLYLKNMGRGVIRRGYSNKGIDNVLRNDVVKTATIERLAKASLLMGTTLTTTALRYFLEDE